MGEAAAAAAFFPFFPFFSPGAFGPIYLLCFQRAVSLFQIRASGLFVLDDVRHGRRVATFGYDRAICDFERLIGPDIECFRALIHR